MINAIEGALKSTDPKTEQLKHFTVDDTDCHMRANYGAKISNTDFWLRVVSEESGRQGPMLLEDSLAREKIHHFDHERIPERVVHARGVGAHGYFKLNKSISKICKAGILTDTSRITPVFVRFSTVQGSRGSADTVRDVRGFAVKFYTDEGNWDIVGNDIPVFFIQDALKFPDLIHSVKPEPDTEVPQGQSAHNNFWDFAGLHTETLHTLMQVMSDRGIPKSLRMISGHGVNTFILINDEGKRTFVKFHFLPELGVHQLVWDEALKLCGQDPDFHRKDLYEAINMGVYPKWQFGIQTLAEEDEDKFEFDILDATKVWPEEEIPIQIIGELVLNRNVDEFFPETEQVAFCTAHVVPGIGFSNDPLLQGRNFSYLDTQISRLGGMNFHEIPINRPLACVANSNRDGMRRMKITKGKINYWPNRFDSNPPVKAEEGGYVEHKEEVCGWKQRLLAPKFGEHYSQAELFVNSLKRHEFLHLVNAITFELSHCEEMIVVDRMVDILADIHDELAQRVAEKVTKKKVKEKTRPKHGRKSETLSLHYFLPKVPSVSTRKIALLLADGFDLSHYRAISAALEALGALPVPIGVRRGPIIPEGEDGDGNQSVDATMSFESVRSTAFDALLIIGGAQHILTLRENGRVLHWIHEAFGHCKAIGAVGDGVDLLQHANLPAIELALEENKQQVVNSYGVVTLRNATEEHFLAKVINLTRNAADFLSSFAYEVSQHRNWERELDGLTSRVSF